MQAYCGIMQFILTGLFFFSKLYSASVTEASFFTYHTKIHDTVKGKLAAAKLTSLFSKLQKGFAQGLDQVQTGW